MTGSERGKLFDFAPYRQVLGAEPADITSFETLNLFLDRNGEGVSTPRFRRLPIGSLNLGMGWKQSIRRRFQENPLNRDHRPEPGWLRLLVRRRRRMLMLSLAVTVLMFIGARKSLFAGFDGRDVMQDVYMALYLLFTFLAVYSFTKMSVGYWLTLRGPEGNPYHPAHEAQDPPEMDRCAILYPVHHEDMHRVGAGIASLIESFEKDLPEKKHHYEVFLLSDSTDAYHVLTEQAAIYHLKQTYPDMVIHYRHRAHNANAKLGNIVDFLRRWGRDYTYIYMMDADSIVSGTSIHQCLRMMAGNSQIGIIQTNPLPVLRRSFFGRLLQFSSHLHGSVLSHGLGALAMGHASYIGHNAIIRTDAFIQHCILPELPGGRPWGGKPLSHDIAEAAMMGRAGYEVWFLADIRGSYEEIPATMSGFLRRENRWLQGNLQNIRLLFTDGLQGLHRETLLMGALAYAMAPLGAMFMIASVYTATHMVIGQGESDGPEMFQMMSLGLFALAMIFVFSPRLIALSVAMRRKNAPTYGGRCKLLFSAMLEMMFTLFCNPVIMCFIIRFLLACLWRSSVTWQAQQRHDVPLTFRECLRDYWWCSAIGVLAGGMLKQVMEAQPDYSASFMEQLPYGLLPGNALLIWFIPVIVSLLLAPVMAFLTSQISTLANRCRWFLIPEEVSEPAIIKSVKRHLAMMRESFPTAGAEIIRYSLENPRFYVCHYRHSRHRKAIAARLLPRIRAGEVLDQRSLMIALKERACFVALVKQHLAAQGYSV